MVDTLSFEGFERIGEIMADKVRAITNLKPMFALLASDFYKDERRIFSLKGKGKFTDLSKKYKDQKQKNYGFVYPILRASGKLEQSLTNPSSSNALQKFTNTQMLLGTNVKYANYHHSEKTPRKKIPRRPLWDENPDGNLSKRWADTVDAYFEKVLGRKPTSPHRADRTF